MTEQVNDLYKMTCKKCKKSVSEYNYWTLFNEECTTLCKSCDKKLTKIIADFFREKGC